MSAALFKKARLKVLTAAILGMFAGGAVPGVFLDANDWGPTGTNGTGVVFQDMTGTPVTAMEQPVQLILDKSQGLVLGTTLTISSWNNFSGTFETFASSGSTITSAINAISSAYCYTSKTNMVAGKWYVLNINLTLNSGAAPFISTGDNGASNNLGSLKTTQLVAGANKLYVLYIGDGNDYLWLSANTGVASNFSLTISITPIAGNHAYAPASANRPIITARYNQFTETEFRNGTSDLAFKTALVTASSLSGYLGAVAFGFNGVDAATGYKNIATGATAYKLSVVISMDDGNAPTFGSASGSAAGNTFMFVHAGNTTSPTSNVVTSLGGGKYLVTYTGTGSAAATNFGITKYATNDNRTFKTSAWDIRPSDQATGLIPTYQRVNTATDYDWSPAFPPIIKGNSTNQYLTGNMDLSGTNKVTVWAGVRKFSDAQGMIFETSTTFNSNNGAMYLIASPGNRAAWQFNSKGTTPASSEGNGTAPQTAVLTGIGDISAPIVNVRVNGTPAAVVTTSQGTGNYGNYAYYLFSRGGTSIFWSGGFNAIIVLGRAANDSEIKIGEQYSNIKIKAA